MAKFRVHDPIAEPEREVALQQVATVEALHPGVRVKTVGAEKAYHRRDFVAGCRQRGIAPQLACKHGVRVAGLDVRTTAKPGYRLSQKVRKRVEEIFGWIKTVGGLRLSRYRGRQRTQAWGYPAVA